MQKSKVITAVFIPPPKEILKTKTPKTTAPEAAAALVRKTAQKLRGI